MALIERNQIPDTGNRTGDFEFDFEKLNVYQKSLDFIDVIFRLHKNLPSEYRFSIGDNLLRAGLSVANNLAEGNDKISPRERARYFRTSSDSARECVSVFIVLKRQNLIEENLYWKLRRDAREITSMLKGLLK